MRFLFLLLPFLVLGFCSCKKENKDSPSECVVPAVIPSQPYSDPVWHPNGQLLGFNHTPQTGVYANGTPPCIWYMNALKLDSMGFYLMNKNGFGLRRVTNFMLTSPAWSPDGAWLAFSVGANIYKMPFNGNNFDTSKIIQITNSGGNFYPSWTANSDSLYFDSNLGSSNGSYIVWKMNANGTGRTSFPNTGRQPYVGSDGKIYYIGLGGEIFRMEKDGSNQVRYSNIGSVIERPKYWQGKVFYEGNQIGVVQSIGSSEMQIVKPAISYDVSSNGEIIYSKWDYSVNVNDKQRGTLWIMNADGSNRRQLTFNNF